MSAPKISRRAFLTRSGFGTAALTGYTAVLEPEWLETGRHEIRTGIPGQPVKILHLSDFHASWCVSLAYIQQAIKHGLQLQPDLICVTGDFITQLFDDVDGYSRVLARLKGSVPVYASLGNHDGGDWARRHHGHPDTTWVCNLLDKSGIELLENRAMDLRIKDRAIRLVGLGDLHARRLRPEEAFSSDASAPAPYSIVLSHNPDAKELLARYPWDLMLCGHTHGGQLWLPLIGAPFAPVVDTRFIAGLYRWNNRWIHITKGVGNIWGLRFNCRPEVSLLTLT
jgi:predicted MPP superfamily phosphohydrolase